jgi:hypothetical protein
MKAKPKIGPAAVTGSSQARKQAALVLEVLSGLRSPSQAASAMGVAVNRYYQLETRALQGVVDALEPRPRGRQRKPEDEIAALKKDNARLKNELARTSTLLRSTQRALGVPAVRKQKAAPAKQGKAGDGGKRKRKRTPKVRALTHLKHLKQEPGSDTQPETPQRPEAAQEATP